MDTDDADSAYAYVPAGNRLSLTRSCTTNYPYDRADRITAAGATSYTVNANGNLTARGSDTFAYDQANRPKTASVGGTTSTYAYDGDGKRTSKTVGANTTNYAYDANRSLPVLLDDGTRKYVWGIGLAHAVEGTSVCRSTTPMACGPCGRVTDALARLLAGIGTPRFTTLTPARLILWGARRHRRTLYPSTYVSLGNKH